MQQHHCDPLPISASGTDRCACTAANPDYEAVTNGWCARRHVANAERGEWESWKVIRDASPLPPVTRPFLHPNQFLLQESSCADTPFFLIRDIRRNLTLTHCSFLKREVVKRYNYAKRYNYNKRCFVLCSVKFLIILLL